MTLRAGAIIIIIIMIIINIIVIAIAIVIILIIIIIIIIICVATFGGIRFGTSFRVIFPVRETWCPLSFCVASLGNM